MSRAARNKGKRATEDTLSSLHSELARCFIDRLRGGEATAQELNAMRQFLKDNNITCIAEYNEDIQELVASLPVFSAESDSLIE